MFGSFFYTSWLSAHLLAQSSVVSGFTGMFESGWKNGLSPTGVEPIAI